MAALQAASDPASLERSLAGSRQEVHQLRLRQARLRPLLESFPSDFLPITSPAPQLNRVRMEGCGHSGSEAKEQGEKKSLCLVCRRSSFTLKQFKKNKRIKKERRGKEADVEH